MSTVTAYDDYGIIHIDSPKYGEFDFIIDLEDVDKCKVRNWAITRGGRGDFKEYYYAMSTKRKGQHPALLHRYIMNAPKEFDVDHIDGNTLDTRKSNMRLCSFQENCRNRKKCRRNTSGYRGVTWSKKDNKWMAYIHLDNSKKFKNLGYYTDPLEAYNERLKAEEKYYKNFLIAEKAYNKFHDNT